MNVLLVVAIASSTLNAWDLSAPVGPQPNRVIDEAGVTYFVSLDGDDAANGRARQTAFRSMQKAADVVRPGETVLVTRGVYPQGFHYKGIGRSDAYVKFLAEPGAEIRGSDVREDWQRETGDEPIYSIERPKLLGNWQQADTPLYNRLEQVFVNGRLLRMVPDRAMLKPKGTFFVDDAERKLFVCLEDGQDPNQQLTEVSTRTWAIAVGGPPNNNLLSQPQFDALRAQCRTSHVRIDGFRIRHLANFSRNAAVQIRGLCSHILVENCDIQWVNYCGIGVADAEHVVLRNNIASNCGVQGMGSGGTSYLLFENNLLDNNNYKGVSPWSEGGAIKTGFWGTHIVLRGNVARNNHNHGLWIDYGGTDCVIENNFVYNAVAGAVLNEVTPNPEQSQFADGTRGEQKEPDAETVRRFQQQGTIIRNNVLVGTRAPGGGGINISSSSDGRICNNIVAAHVGGGLNYGGSPDREHTAGQARNRCFGNLCYDNYQHATVLRQEDDRHGRTFDNLMESNLFVAARNDPPLRLGGQGVTPDEFESYNTGRGNVFFDGPLFRDPEHFDFTLVDPEPASRVGFDPAVMRLDWSEYFVAPTDMESNSVRTNLQFTPIPLTRWSNCRAGGTDDATTPRTDLRHLPLGRQRFDGVLYELGSRDNGAIQLRSSPVATANYPANTTVPIGSDVDEIYFLYAGVKTNGPASAAEIARFRIGYADGSTVEQPIIVGRQVLDWLHDPTWQESAALNNNRAYLAWRGPSGGPNQANVYYLRWVNENPQTPVRFVDVTTAQATAAGAFLLFGVTTARTPNDLPAGEHSRVFYLSWDGQVDAEDHNEAAIAASGFNRAAFDAGKFVDGFKGKSLRPAKPVVYSVPASWPVGGKGTISMWLNADPIFTPERIEEIRRASYRSVMWPFQGDGAAERYTPWDIQFHIDVDAKKLQLKSHISGVALNADVTDRIQPGKWFQIALTWGPTESNRTQYTASIDGAPVATRVEANRADLIGPNLRLGVPGNGGQPWVGAMDELEIWNDRR